jgi:hypothetical protein
MLTNAQHKIFEPPHSVMGSSPPISRASTPTSSSPSNSQVLCSSPILCLSPEAQTTSVTPLATSIDCLEAQQVVNVGPTAQKTLLSFAGFGTTDLETCIEQQQRLQTEHRAWVQNTAAVEAKKALDALEKTKALTRERVRAFRAKKKLIATESAGTSAKLVRHTMSFLSICF